MQYRESQVLHHVAHASQRRHGLLGALAALRQQVLDAAVRVNLHSAQVVEAVNLARILAKLLVEGIAQIVCGVSGDQEDVLAVLGELNGERARRGRLAHTTLAADEYPAQRLLVDNGLERGLHDFVVVEHSSVGHDGGGVDRVFDVEGEGSMCV